MNLSGSECPDRRKLIRLGTVDRREWATMKKQMLGVGARCQHIGAWSVLEDVRTGVDCNAHLHAEPSLDFLGSVVTRYDDTTYQSWLSERQKNGAQQCWIIDQPQARRGIYDAATTRFNKYWQYQTG